MSVIRETGASEPKPHINEGMSDGRTPETSAPRIAGFQDALLLLRPYRSSLTVAFFVGLAATAAGALQPILVSTMVDTFSGAVPMRPAVLLIGLLVASAILNGVRQLLLQRAGERFAFDARERLIRHIYTLSLSALSRHQRADLVSRVTTDVAQTRAILSSGLVELASSLITILVSIVMMAFIDWTLLGITAAAISTVLVTIFVIGKRTRPAGLRLQTAIGSLAASLTRALGAIKTIRATSSTRREANASVGKAGDALSAGLVVARLRAIVATFTGVTVQVLLIAVIAVGALRVASGALTVGGLSAFIMYLLLMVSPISLFGSIISMLGEAFGALSRILEIQTLSPEVDIQKREESPGPSRDDGALFELESLSFYYTPRVGDVAPTKLALNHVSLQIERCATTAIVGPSGAGKTTLFDLLERFYEPTEGAILFDGGDVLQLSRERLREQIAYVEQDAPALSGTVRENLLLSAPKATDEECLEALMQVNLVLDERAGAGYLNEDVGEVGSRLSGGERQRLAIARAMIAKTPILLLDEVTSNLDSNNERVIQDLIRDRELGRTIIVIAHRLSTVIAADTIIVLKDGGVAAQGTHGTLLESSSLYRELAQNQLLRE